MNKLILSFIVTLSASFASALDLSNCRNDDAACVSEALIYQLGQESRNVQTQRLVNRMKQRCDRYNSKCTGQFVSRAIDQAYNRYEPITYQEYKMSDGTAIAFCRPGDVAIRGRCAGYQDPNWASCWDKPITQNGRQGWQCCNHAKRQNTQAWVTCEGD